MKKSERQGTELFHFENLSHFSEIRHFVSSRAGGYSEGPFARLNLGFHVGDSSFKVLKNRQKLSAATGIDLFWFTFAKQTHSGNVAVVDAASRGIGATEIRTALENTDGMVTIVERICLCVQVADCVPVLMYDPVEHVIAAVHAGWRGILRRIVPGAVEKMIQHYGCRAENIVAGIGPSNGPCCYEVEDDVRRETLTALGSTNGIISPSKNPGKFIFDQWNAVHIQLREAGLREKNIETSGICNQCQAETFFSNRAGQGTSGRYAAGIMLCKR
ncbi:MAG: peptidoglycan editing factor PgeF [Bacteroidales bacterium]|nr:peptidoglycan editing factor PgeF [Bacteroidales bacterium]NLM92732.1 peptidoglycan editing factor PgeF [Bacteroidales bacterium]